MNMRTDLQRLSEVFREIGVEFNRHPHYPRTLVIPVENMLEEVTEDTLNITFLFYDDGSFDEIVID